MRMDARARPLEGHLPDYPYENLIFKGGGAKGAIYPGAIRALEVKGVMPYIKRFAGASAGSLIAALLAAGLSASELCQVRMQPASGSHVVAAQFAPTA